jgi:hypothetical protein
VPARFATAAFASCLFLLILGAKWATFDRFGSAMPDWDQWDAEAVELLIPWFSGDNFLAHLFHPHNEHRVVVTKLHNLALVLLNGQWDARLEAVTNAVVHSALAAAFFLLGARWSAARWHAPLFVVLFALFGLPLAWQNILGGFHSQQYWLLALSFVAIALLPFSRPWSGPWWAGTAAAVVALGTMASGFLAAAVVVVVLVWRLWTRESAPRAAASALAVCLALIATGLLTRVEVPWHAEMKARTVRDFAFSIIHSMEWPLRDQDWAAALLWLPWFLVAAHVVRAALRARAGEPAPARAAQTILALGGWVLVQLVATAYARGAGGDYPASRYMDTLSFGAAVNAVALVWLLTVRPPALASRLSHYALAAAWVGTLGAGLRTLSEVTLRYELPDAKSYYVKAEANLRIYLATDNPKALDHKEIPFPAAEGLVERLGNPHLRALMAPPVRAPLPLAPAVAAGFLENDARLADPGHPPRLGLSPATPPLDGAKTWGTYAPPVAAGSAATAPAEFRSAPLRAALPGGWLKFETAGHAGQPGLTLEVRDAATGALLAPVVPDRTPGDTFRAAYVRKPAVPFVVVARDEAPDRWLAFGGPVELGSLSYLARLAVKHGLLLAQIALGLTLALFAATLLLRRRPAARA